MAGSLNFKTKYAPEFPVVQITRAQPGKTVMALGARQEKIPICPKLSGRATRRKWKKHSTRFEPTRPGVSFFHRGR